MVVEALFDSREVAERVYAELVRAGIQDSRIAMSVDPSADPLAGEYPGQSYENQPGQDSSGDARGVARRNDAVRAARCSSPSRHARRRRPGRWRR